MERIFNFAKRASAVFALSGTAAVVLAAQTVTTLHRFNGHKAFEPMAGLVQATNGDLYGTTFGGWGQR
jgi:hypothetical protein